MQNQHAAVSRRLSDPDFQASLVNKCLALVTGMAILVAAFAVHDAWIWAHPPQPRYFLVDGKNPPHSIVGLDSPIVDDAELLEWTVHAALAPYNVNYHDYPQQLNTASGRFSVHGWNSFANSYIQNGNFAEMKRARLLCYAQAQRAGVIPMALVADARSQWRNALRFSALRRSESQRQGRMV